ncbi:MAG TPA: tetratricopeptide repeat protein [Alphaproteobacteria bacterium]|nr:tetratricopeptide repeat protein [Alphaproteobacteria bacterium]
MTRDAVTRRLAAIFAADMVGYSRLMSADEEGTIARQKTHRRELIDPKIAEHGGRIVKLMGDGMLVEFASVVDAVRCAVEVQREMAERECDVPEDKRICYRVGINLGDIVIDGDDILGDGVNIAARLEAMAEPGGVLISRAARDQIRDKLDLPLEDLGEHTVKNIARPVRMFSVLLEDPAASKAGTKGPMLADKPTIAVLAFENMSGDPEQEYFADGIAEDIITALSKFREFIVIARNSSFTYKGSAVDIKRVAQELGVRYVLEGSVRKAGARVRITGQLIDAPTGAHIWAERYDRGLEDIFAVQDEITQSIVGAIAPGIVSAEVQRAQRKDAGQLGAWDCVMRAHAHTVQFTQESVAEAGRLLTQAIALDPGNVTALSDLAFIQHLEGVWGWSDSPPESMARMDQLARKAVAIDDRDASAHVALAIAELFASRHDEALRRLERAVHLNPNLAWAHGYLGAVHSFAADLEAAIPCMETAIRLSPHDPLLVIWHAAPAWAALITERYDEAIAYANKALAESRSFVDTYVILASACGHAGRIDEAKAALDEYQRHLPGLTLNDPRLIRPFKRPGDQERFLEGLRKAGLPE